MFSGSTRTHEAVVVSVLFVNLIQAQLTTRRLGREISYARFTDSTNADLWELLDEGDAVAGQVAVTDHQRAGRGRHGRPWFSAPDLALPFSVLLEPELPPERLGLLSLAMGVAVVDAVAAEQVDARLKWPNDILVEQRKLGGILAESRTVDGRLLVVLGTGLNVNEQATDFPEELHAGAVSLRMLKGVPVQRELLLAGVLNRFEALESGGLDDVTGLWEERCAHLEEPVRVQGPDGELAGRFLGLDDVGHARLDVDGRTEVVSAGDMDWIAN